MPTFWMRHGRLPTYDDFGEEEIDHVALRLAIVNAFVPRLDDNKIDLSSVDE